MTIFFLGSLHGSKKYRDNYEKIVKIIEDSGHKVFADHNLKFTTEYVQSLTEESNIAFHKKLIDQIKKSQAIFVESSYSSTSIGYLAAHAVSIGKPLVIFYSGETEPHLFTYIEKTNERVTVIRYKDLVDLDVEVPMMIDFVSDMQDTRFNFFVSPTIASYLDWIAKHNRIPRSVYLRKLIDQDMAKKTAYKDS